MLAAILPKMTGLGALWRVDPVGVLLPETAPLTHVKTSKVHAAPVRGADAISREKDAIRHKSKRMSINDRLRAIMGDMLTEDELQQKFTFGRLLGSGATSKVYAAVDTTIGREVAIKVFDKAAMIEVRRSMVADGDYTQEKAVYRVQRRLLKIVSELEISKSLKHPNIIKYLGAYETSHRLCIVHELVEGCDLLEHLLAHGKMKEVQAAHVMRQLLSALHYCHERHVYHRDLKLEKYVVLTTENAEESVVSQSNVESPEWSKGTSSPSKGSRRRSLSCLSENGTEGTSSTSGSFDDDSETAAERKQQAPRTVVVAAAAAAAKTHLSCLENDLDCM
uniref:non-specific serine/threonine protein kinase n=1 Tax=Globisporangium ultimum (strain ATCC 200006 / CBS 805.95 / DAOM BR144) TaxID=431595 RepID=K3X679_GLOUD